VILFSSTIFVELTDICDLKDPLFGSGLFGFDCIPLTVSGAIGRFIFDVGMELAPGYWGKTRMSVAPASRGAGSRSSR
jgi:hypothetical protein